MASTDVNKVTDRISKTFTPCGVDDVNDEDIANAMQLCFGNRAIKDDEEVDDIDMERVEGEAEAAQVKAEYSDAWKRFRDLSEDLMNTCEGDAPWIKLPMVTHPRLIMRSHDSKLDYQPKIIFIEEKDYLSWIERDGMAHYFHWRRENERVTPQSENGKYLFWETWVCHRCGKPENKPRKTTKELIRHSQKVGCRAKLYVHKLKAGSDVDPAYETKRGQELVRLTYYYKHQGHILGNGDDFRYLRISSRMKNKIWDLVDAGLDVRHIQSNLMASSGDPRQQLENKTISRDDFITSEDVLGVVRSYWEKKAERHRTVVISLCLWMDHLKSQGFFVFRAQDQRAVERLDAKGCSSAVGFASAWQLEQLQGNSEAIGLDSMHCVSKGVYELYTITIQDPQTMRGIPVAFLLTEDRTPASLQLWLMELKKLVGGFRYVTTDDSKVERCAIQGAFGDSVKIYLCLWHVARAWSQAIRSHVKGPSPKESERIREQARNALRNIMYEADLVQANRMIEELRQDWEDHHSFIAYLNENYFQDEERRRMWMKAYRTDTYYASMDTNNFVESWHNHLKHGFLRRHHKVRADRVIYLLSHTVVEYFRKGEFCNYIQVGRKTKGQVMDILRQREVQAMAMEDIKNRVRKVDGEFCVLSFTHPDLFYKVLVDAQNMVTGCDCPYFLRLRRICKHILIAYKVYEAELLLPLQLVFRHAARRPSVEPPAIEYDDTLLDMAHATISTDKQEEKRQQDILNLAALTALESLKEYVRTSHCDQAFVNKLHELIRQAEELPLKEDHFRKRKRQEY